MLQAYPLYAPQAVNYGCTVKWRAAIGSHYSVWTLGSHATGAVRKRYFCSEDGIQETSLQNKNTMVISNLRKLLLIYNYHYTDYSIPYTLWHGQSSTSHINWKCTATKWFFSKIIIETAAFSQPEPHQIKTGNSWFSFIAGNVSVFNSWIWVFPSLMRCKVAKKLCRSKM